MLVKRVQSAYLFDNGNLAASDIRGDQIPELQGPYSIEKHQRIVAEALDTCEFKGFEQVPRHWQTHVYSFANYLRRNNLSWEEMRPE
jgi:hypothetical protein